MRRRRFELLVAFIMVGCGGPATDRSAPRADTALGPSVSPDTAPASTASTDTAAAPGPEPLPRDSASESDPWSEARERGVDFRAVGQEPGWFLEIDDGETIVFAYDYGAERTVVPAPVPFHDEVTNRLTYRTPADSLELVIIIDVVPCFDTMSGEAFDRTVTVSLGAREYRGCGRVL